MSSRFDYVRYDDTAAAQQAATRKAFEEVERQIMALSGSRAVSLALTKIEEAYMWVGKAIRDEQILRGGDSKDQPARG